jgi:hypothetical protein
MEETQMNEKSLKEIFRDFLFNLEDFLHVSSIIENTTVKILYIQEPVKSLNEYFARGIVKIGDSQYVFEAMLETDLENIKIDSVAFYFHLKVEEAKQFLQEIRNHGGEE